MVTVVATDTDDPTYGNSARLTYSIVQGQPYFSVEPKTGETQHCTTASQHTWTQQRNKILQHASPEHLKLDATL